MNLWRRLRRKRVPLSELKTADIMASKSSLEHSVDSWEAVAHCFTALVGVGLIIEYRDPFVKFWNTHDWRYITDAIGGILVTAGVAGEFITGLRSTSKDGQLREANSVLTIRAAETIAASNERIAELNVETEHLRKENNEMLIFLGDRRIIDPIEFQQAMYVFPETAIIMGVADDREAIQFAASLRHNLMEAGWNVGHTHNIGDDQEGLFIAQSGFDDPGPCSPAAEALADALNANRVATITGLRNAAPPWAMTINVGIKPKTPEMQKRIQDEREAQKKRRSSDGPKRTGGPLSPKSGFKLYQYPNLRALQTKGIGFYGRHRHRSRGYRRTT